MSDPIHTPGPWRFGGGLDVRYAGSNPRLHRYKVAECGCVEDAKLIAAAPNLLEAARLALAWENGQEADGVGSLDVIYALRRAIAKAEKGGLG